MVTEGASIATASLPSGRADTAPFWLNSNQVTFSSSSSGLGSQSSSDSNGTRATTVVALLGDRGASDWVSVRPPGLPAPDDVDGPVPPTLERCKRMRE